MTTYYVDATNGNNSNNGTSSGTAWQTIAKLNGTTFQPGDTILLKRGETWREAWSFQGNGANGNLITIDAYGTGGNAPLISGTDILTGWTLNSGSIYQVSYTNAITTNLLIEDNVIATK